MLGMLYWTLGREQFTSREIAVEEQGGITSVFFSIPGFYIEGCISFSAMNTEIETKGSYTVLVDTPQTRAISVVGSTNTEQCIMRFKGVWFAPDASRDKGTVEIFLARARRTNASSAPHFYGAAAKYCDLRS